MLKMPQRQGDRGQGAGQGEQHHHRHHPELDGPEASAHISAPFLIFMVYMGMLRGILPVVNRKKRLDFIGTCKKYMKI